MESVLKKLTEVLERIQALERRLEALEVEVRQPIVAIPGEVVRPSLEEQHRGFAARLREREG